MKKTLLFLILLVFVLFAKAQIKVHYISPIAVNTWVKSYMDEHVAMHVPNHKSPKNKLLVTLVPDGYVPEDMQIFDSVAAQLGFHVIGLSYSNSPHVNAVCKDHIDPDCHKKVRNEVLEATSFIDYVQIDSNNGIRQRLSQLIVFLNDSFPEENWGQFNSSKDTPNWSNILIAGYGESASQALYIAQKHKTNRAICFAGIPDKYKGELASWMNASFSTDKKDMYHFQQENDSSLLDTNYFNLLNTANTKHSSSIEFDINENFKFSRILNTNFITDYKKEIIAIDDFTPINKDNSPRFKEVWQYVLVNNKTSSLSEMDANINIYPNPVNNVLKISTPYAQELQWTLHDLTGQIVKSGKNHIIEISALKQGIYFMHLNINNIKIVKKISISRP